MEIRQFAEGVLYGRTLAEKLLVPGRLTDADRGSALTASVTPHRPAGLGLGNAETPRANFPRAAELDGDDARGRALHFFANHELLALELMALTLLRFPDAPPAFRKRIVATMRDEQRHMGLYIERMTELGVELGEISLNSFFWDLLSSISSPMEFITGMSLTFEQANLDFSLHYRDAFKTVGDQKTAEIMEQVLVDEVAHVRHGLHFFEKWRSPELSQWESYRKSLVFPLTPARAKGIGFTRQHRRDAGLEDDFIDHLEVYSHSRGRSPRVLMFNPDAEAVMGQGTPGYNPPQAIVQLTRDLELLPMFLASRDDVILVSDPPAPAHLSGLMKLGYGIPELVSIDRSARQLPKTNALASRRLAELTPWGWDPDIARFLQPLAGCVQGGPADLVETVAARGPLASKAWLAERVPELLGKVPDPWRSQCITDLLPAVATDAEGLAETLGTHKEAGHEWSVVKAPYGSAGRAALRIDRGGPTDAQLRWIENTIQKQGSVVVEPWYTRELDFSYLFKIDGVEMHEVGFSHFLTDAGGRYRGALLAPLKSSLPSKLRPFVYRAGGDENWLWETVRTLTKALLPQLVEAGFSGPAGLDLMLVRDLEGQPKLRAPLELNPRPTMGHVAKALARPLGTRASGVWLLVTKRDLEGTDATDFPALVSALQSRLPTEMIGDPPTLAQGVFSTNDPQTARQACSICIVANRLDEAIAAVRESVLSPMIEGLRFD